jgi:hypothetical protein
VLPKHLFYNNREIIAIGDSDVRPAIIEQATALTLDQVLPTLQNLFRSRVYKLQKKKSKKKKNQ